MSKLDNTWKYIIVIAVLITFVGIFYMFAGGQQSILGVGDGTDVTYMVNEDGYTVPETVTFDKECQTDQECVDYLASISEQPSDIYENQDRISCQQKCVVDFR